MEYIGFLAVHLPAAHYILSRKIPLTYPGQAQMWNNQVYGAILKAMKPLRDRAWLVKI